jgi:hypothetical protein
MPRSTPPLFPVISVIFVVLVAINVVIAMLPVEVAMDAVREGHMIEQITAVGYFSAVILLLVKGVEMRSKTMLSSGGMLLLLGLRELDFHSKFTTMGIFKTKFYVSSSVPILEKAIVSVIVIVLIIFIFLYLKKYTGPFLKALRKKKSAAICVAIGIGAMFLSKFLDSCSDFIEEIVIHFYDVPDLFSRMIEETVEMTIPFLFILATFYSLKKKN